MSATENEKLNDKSKDPTHIGEAAAQQPLSGNAIVTDMRFKGFSGAAFVQIDETKKTA